MKKYFDKYRHNIKGTIIEIQFLMDDQKDGKITNKEYIEAMREQFAELESQTTELEKLVEL